MEIINDLDVCAHYGWTVQELHATPGLHKRVAFDLLRARTRGQKRAHARAMAKVKRK